jgi:hypothetical protein
MTGRPGSANMSYAMSPSTKRMMVSKQGINNQSAPPSSYASIPTPKHVGPAMQQTASPSYSNQYAQSGQPNPYRTARKAQQQQQQQQNAQQMMYQQ